MHPPTTPLSAPAACRILVVFLSLQILFMTSADGAETGMDNEPAKNANWDLQQWSLQTSLYTWHWHPSPEHNNHQHLLALEGLFRNQWLVGGTVFRNSFNQSSQLVYMGRRWYLEEHQHWYFKLTGGLLHGYREPNEDKIPLNGLGIAPVILPTLGFQHHRLLVETTFAGVAAVTITAGINFR